MSVKPVGAKLAALRKPKVKICAYEFCDKEFETVGRGLYCCEAHKQKEKRLRESKGES